MKADIKAKWLAALRSGKYQQGRGALLQQGDGDNEYCCLGVLGSICGANSRQLSNGQILEDVDMGYVLGPWQPRKPGFYPFEPGRPETHVTIQRVLAAMNDNGKSFAEIADYIEANVPAVIGPEQ